MTSSKAKWRRLNLPTMGENMPNKFGRRWPGLLTMATFHLSKHLDLFWDGGLRHGRETEGVMWDTPVTRLAGDEDDWIQK